MTHNLSKKNSILNHFVSELRDENIQQDRMRFRKNLFRIAQIIAYEISQKLVYKPAEVTTPLGMSETAHLEDQIVLLSILRAGIPMHDGLLDFFDHADNAFVSAYRSHHKDGTFEINLQYITCPDLNDKVLIITDPMLATGSSIESTLEAIQDYGTPKSIHIATVIASKQGVGFINRVYPNITIWAAAIDDELTAKSYIVPGLGDAGDLAFGNKLQD